MQKNWRTTAVAIITAVVSILLAAKAILSGQSLDVATIVQSVLGLLAALGFYHAADAANLKP